MGRYLLRIFHRQDEGRRKRKTVKRSSRPAMDLEENRNRVNNQWIHIRLRRTRVQLPIPLQNGNFQEFFESSHLTRIEPVFQVFELILFSGLLCTYCRIAVNHFYDTSKVGKEFRAVRSKGVDQYRAAKST